MGCGQSRCCRQVCAQSVNHHIVHTSPCAAPCGGLGLGCGGLGYGGLGDCGLGGYGGLGGCGLGGYGGYGGIY